jgi:hypothetical protein
MGQDAKLRVSIRPSAESRRSLPLDVGSPALLMFMTGCRVGIARLLRCLYFLVAVRVVWCFGNASS